MARTTRKSEVFLTPVPTDGEEVQTGTFEKLAKGRWRSQCALCEEFFLAGTKKAAVLALDDHFIETHSTLNV